jgi:uncharacterized protein (TIGR03382 family)
MRTALLASLLVLGATAPAIAHFKLMSPASMTAQDASLGDPQKGAPCGPNGAITETGAITQVMTGGMLAVTIDETITHPGHYRVAIAQDLAGLPAAPIVTGANCGMTTIQTNPVLPVLKDGLFQHTAAFSGPQTAMVQLPAGFTCTNCIVQVIEFMSAHTTPCFYYHCARVTITDSPVVMPDGAPTGGPDAGTTPPGSGNVDGGCSTTDGSGLVATALFAGLLAVRRRRRRR